MLDDLTDRLDTFSRALAAEPDAALSADAESYGFICRRYALCTW